MKKILKIVAVLCASALLVGIGFVSNMFLGNPISYYLAYNSAKKYIEENYKDTDYQVERVAYNFKFADYMAYITSSQNIDEHFSLQMDYKGNVEFSDYEHLVVDRQNVVYRLREEYNNVIISEGLRANLPYNFIGNLVFEFTDLHKKHKDALGISNLELNKTYDMTALAKNQGYITVWTEMEEPNLERLAEILLEVKRVADENEVAFYALDVSLFRPGNAGEIVGVDVFLYEDIYEDGLIERIEINIEETKAYYEEMYKDKQTNA